MERNIYKIGEELFITSHEEIKEGDYILIHGHYQYGKHVTKVRKITGTYEVIEGGNHSKKICQKIILTTDQDLIKDGVQSIDNEFLEWFVKNPSCQEVEIESKITKDGVWTDLKGYVELPTIHSISYKIIIPKEEPKQETSIVEGLKDILAHITKMNSRHEKQETLEEAAERIYPIHIKSIIDKYDDGITNVIGEEDINEDNRESFINGAKWQQERSYSEEEVLEIVSNCDGSISQAKKLFKQFKNK